MHTTKLRQVKTGADVLHLYKYLGVVERTYEKRMRERVFGYELVGIMRDEAAHTSKSISPVVKKYCDEVLLEGKIPDKFKSNKTLNKLSQRIHQELITKGLCLGPRLDCKGGLVIEPYGSRRSQSQWGPPRTGRSAQPALVPRSSK